MRKKYISQLIEQIQTQNNNAVATMPHAAVPAGKKWLAAEAFHWCMICHYFHLHPLSL
jgi:hypothetical protein